MKKILFAASLAVIAAPTHAGDIDSLQLLGQDQFRLLSEDLGAALSYKALAPAEPLGITGFDIGGEVTVTTLANDEILELASSGSSVTSLPVAKVHAHKGLPFGFDVGAFYASVPDSNISLVGAELRYALIEGGVAMPAVSVRGTYSALNGVDQLDFSTTGLELSISKGFAMLTPYAGVGTISVTSTPQNVPLLAEETFSLTKYFVGVNVNLGLLNFAFEGDQTGDATTYSGKIGWRF